jgi:hypothetical protein
MTDYLQREDESREDDGQEQQWRMSERDEIEDLPAEENEDQAGNDREPDPRAHSELFRAGKIDAYLRYLKMRPAQRESEPVTLRRAMPIRERPHYRSLEDDEEVHLHGFQRRPIRRPAPRAPRLAAQRHRPSHAREIAIATALSLAVAGVTGLIVYDRTSGGTLSGGLASLWGGGEAAAPAQVAKEEATRSTQTALADAEPVPAVAQVEQAPASKKPVSIAQLEVEDVSGLASALIPLSLRAGAGTPGQDLALKLSGLPDKAYLTAGTRLSGDAWMLRPGEELGVKLVVPPTHTGQFAISVEAIEARTGDLAAPVKEMTVDVRPALAAQIEPAAAPVSVSRNFNLPKTEPPAAEPPVAELPAAEPQPDSAMPIPAPIEKTSIAQSEAARGLLRSGDKLMGLGDLTAARQFYSKALDQGVVEAAFKLGQTYDPAVFAEKNVQGLKPDPSMAMKYYLQAQASGVTEAAQSISGLESWMQQ